MHSLSKETLTRKSPINTKCSLVTRVLVSLWGACAAGRLTAGMPIEQFVVSEVEAARSPSYGLGRKPEHDPRALGGATGTSPFSHAPRNEADAGASPSTASDSS